MTQAQSNRIIYLDYIKALGICLVIFYHCQFVPFDSMLIQGMYAMCVPLFFVVNGMLMLRREYSIRELLKKNLKLLVVMLFWALVSTLVYMCVTENYVSDKGLTGVSSLVYSSLFLTKPECNHLWFLKAIFVLNLFQPIIFKFINNNDKGLCYLIIMMALWSVAFLDIITCRIANPFVSWMTAYSVLYYLAGYAVLNNRLPKMDLFFKGRKGVCFLIGAICFCALLQLGYNWVLVDGPLKELNFEKGWVADIVFDNYNALVVVIMTLSVCVLFKQINWKSNRFWLFVGRNSLAIYVLQTPVQRLLQHLLPLRQMTVEHHFMGLLLSILTLLISVGISWLLQTNKYTKFLITI